MIVFDVGFFGFFTRHIAQLTFLPDVVSCFKCFMMLHLLLRFVSFWNEKKAASEESESHTVTLEIRKMSSLQPVDF